MRGPRETVRRRIRAMEYALVIITIVIIIVLAGWFLGTELANARYLSRA